MRATNTGPLTDAIQLLTVQHRDAARRWTELQQAHRRGLPGEPSMAADLVELLSVHDAIEAMVLYPALRHAGDDGERLASESLDDHHRVRELLVELDGADVDERAFATFEACMTMVLRHVAHEEQEVFPHLRRTLPDDRLMTLGDELRAAMEVAPTHPHRHLPDHRLGAKVAGGIAGAVDRARDALGRSGHR
jgi:hypothetical protein